MLLGRRRRTIDPSKDTQFTDAWIILAAGITLSGVIFNSIYLTTVAILLLIITALSWLWTHFAWHGLDYSRRFGERRAFQGETITLELSVRNGKFLPLTWLTIRDTFPTDLPVSEHDLIANPATNLAEFSTFWMVGPFQRVTRRFEIDCVTRGFHKYGPVSMISGDGFGFFDKSRVLEQEERLIIYPRVYSVDELRLPTKNPFGDSRAQGRLYEDPLRSVGIREWQETDSPRRIHWKATARQQKLLSRVYEPSAEQQVLLFLNVATLERHWYGFLPELQERTISVTGSLALLATEQRLPIGLIANGALPGSDQPIRLLPGRSPDQLVRILELLAALTPFTTAPIEQMLIHEAPSLPWGSTVVVVTAIAHDALLASLIDLAHAGRKVVLFTLAERPPQEQLKHIMVYHLPHLIDDIIAPQLIQTGLP